MPRTKLPKVKSEKKELVSENKLLEKKFRELKKKINERINIELQNFNTEVAMLKIKYKDDMGKTLKELEECQSEAIEDLTKSCSIISSKSVSDEGYLTSASSTSTDFKNSHLSSAHHTASTKLLNFSGDTQFKTPMPNATMTKQMAIKMGFVTPKVRTDKAVKILRPAKAGETVISMTGSPVMLNCPQEVDPHATIPLGDGRVLTVQSENGLRLSGIPEIDNDTKRRLDILKRNIEQLLGPSGPSN